MVVVGTWNRENLYRPGSPFGPQTQEAYEGKLATLAATLTGFGPDVLAVQEIGDPAALEDLVGRLDGDWTVSLSTPRPMRTSAPASARTPCTGGPGRPPPCGSRRPGS